MSEHIIQYLGNFNPFNSEFIHIKIHRRKRIPSACDNADTFKCCECNKLTCTNCNKHNLTVRNKKGKIDDSLAICNLCMVKKIFNPLGIYRTDADIFVDFLNGIKDIFKSNNCYYFLGCNSDDCGFNVAWNNLRKYKIFKFNEVVFYDVATKNICINNSPIPLQNLCSHCKYVRFMRCDYELLTSILISYTYVPTKNNSPFDANKQCNFVRWGGSEVYISSAINSLFLKYVECDKYHFSQLTYTPNYLIFKHNVLNFNLMNKLNFYEDIYADYVLSKYHNTTTPNKKLYYKHLYVYLNNNVLCELKAMVSPECLFSDYFAHHAKTKLFNDHIHINIINDPTFIIELNKFRRTNNHRFCAVIPIDSTYFNYIDEKVYLDARNSSTHNIFKTEYAKHITDYFSKTNIDYRYSEVYPDYRYTNLYPDNDYAKMLLKTSLYLTLLHLDKQWVENVFVVNDQVIVLSAEKNLVYSNIKHILTHINILKNFDIQLPDKIGNELTWFINGEMRFYDLRQRSLVSADHQIIIYSDVIRRCFLKWMNVLYRPVTGSRYLTAKIDFENMLINV